MSRRRERGSASVELVGLVPLVALGLVLLMQLLTAVYTVQAASQAARDAARAHSLEQSPHAAAQRSLPGAVRLARVETFGPHHGVRVTVEAPAVLVLGDRLITREVVMP
ncbi:TadE/TadG family type IV pilus assembly protein [Desertihabitans aurantiacus]|uniref:TadE/TadG family type IV pilus assembly protein n=1 Tax=Desertihabitans aurantiacus TaxID=2282477 RepID=UPI000DF73274|nr:TadE/TadG family type IV pilus assembly protein [Desertihabitans aurantiacus]